MKFKLLTILFMGFLFSCHQKQDIKNENADYDMDFIQGDWILSNYLDEIIENKSIEPQIRLPIVINAIKLQIDKDSIFSYGSLFGNENRLSSKKDSLTSFDNYTLSYVKSENLIKATSPNDSIIYSFRRFKESEKQLIEKRRFHNNLTNYFIEKLFVGEYISLNNNDRFSLLKDGNVDNSDNYKKFQIHNYFGTLHPYEGDAIIFELKTPKQFPFDVFNWKFSGDTLILTEMLTDDLETFYKGKKEIRYIKKNKHN